MRPLISSAKCLKISGKISVQICKQVQKAFRSTSRELSKGAWIMGSIRFLPSDECVQPCARLRAFAQYSKDRVSCRAVAAGLDSGGEVGETYLGL